MAEFTPVPVPVHDNYFSKNNHVFGFSDDPTEMEPLGIIKDFRVIDGVIYFSAIETIDDGEKVETVTHHYKQDGDTPEKVSELPDFVKDFAVLSEAPYRVEKETYKGGPISAVYFGEKREPFYMVSGAMVVPDGLLLNIDNGRGPARPAGLWLWKEANRPPVRLGEAGTLW